MKNLQDGMLHLSQQRHTNNHLNEGAPCVLPFREKKDKREQKNYIFIYTEKKKIARVMSEVGLLVQERFKNSNNKIHS